MKKNLLLTEDDMRITPYLEMGELPEEFETGECVAVTFPDLGLHI